MRYSLYKWQGVSNSLLNDRLSYQRNELLEAVKAQEKAKNETEDVYQSFGEELSLLERQVEELTRVNDIKETEIQALIARLAQVGDKPLLVQGDEDDMYAGEVKEIILEAIDDALSKVKQGTRREHVLRDIIDNNNYEKLDMYGLIKTTIDFIHCRPAFG